VAARRREPPANRSVCWKKTFGLLHGHVDRVLLYFVPIPCTTCAGAVHPLHQLKVSCVTVRQCASGGLRYPSHIICQKLFFAFSENPRSFPVGDGTAPQPPEQRGDRGAPRNEPGPEGGGSIICEKKINLPYQVLCKYSTMVHAC
jgi:hypothetical protein